MSYRVKTIEHKFSPKEVERVSGVSTALQRDWRRRGVIEGRSDGWNKFELDQVIQMAVMRAFTRSGISIETAELVSSLAVLPVIDELVRWDDVAVFTGDKLSKDEMDCVRRSHVVGASGDQQFTFVALPEEDGGANSGRLRNIADCEQLMGMDNFYGIALDHYRLAHRIAKLSPLPIIRFDVEVIDDVED